MERIQQWSLGCSRTRQTEPGLSGTSIVWRVPAESGDTIRLGKPTARQCVDASSVLPRPDSSEVFIISGGLLFTVDMKGTRKAVKLEQPGDSGWRMSQLLALRRSSGPLEILAAMVRKNTSGTAAARSVWLLTVRGSKATGQQFSGLERYRTAEEFTKDFLVPRCADPKLGECLVMREQASAPGSRQRENRLGKERRRGEPVTDVPDTEDVIDAAWDGKGQIVLLTSGDCSP